MILIIKEMEKYSDLKLQFSSYDDNTPDDELGRVVEKITGNQVTIGWTLVSCGVFQFNGLSALQGWYEKTETPDKDYYELMKFLVKKTLGTARGIRYLIVSDKAHTREEMHKCFTKHAITTTPAKNNPNSGNDIIVWVFDLGD